MSEAEDTQRVTVSIENGVADVRLNRPDKMNALDSAQFEALHSAAQQLAADASVRAVVLSGEGRAFCAGLDFSGFESMAGNGDGASRLGDVDDGRITHYAQQAVYGCQLHQQGEIALGFSHVVDNHIDVNGLP